MNNHLLSCLIAWPANMIIYYMGYKANFKWWHIFILGTLINAFLFFSDLAYFKLL